MRFFARLLARLSESVESELLASNALLEAQVCHQTILNVLRRNGYHPAERHAGADSWAWFLNVHRSIVVATDFFSVEVLTPRGLVTYFVLFFIELKRRTVYLAGITAHPNEQWMMQVARNLTMADSGFLIGKAHVIMDRDAKYCPRFRAYLRREGIRVIRSPPMSPNMNAYAERWVRSVKHECLRFIIPVSRASLERALGEYVAHYNAERIHQGLDQEIPIPLSPKTRQIGPVQRTSRLGGLLNYYH